MLRTVRAWLIAAHAFPLAAVMALTGLIAFVSAGGTPNGATLCLLMLAMLGSQLAIGWSNDYVDRDVDALHQPWKPIARGELDASKLPFAVVASLTVSALAGVFLGIVPLLLLAAGTSAGIAYNLWLKGTPFSALPFLVALGVLPPFVWASLDVYREAFLGLYAVATPLALAAHLANVLPDSNSDRSQGRMTLAVVLGERASMSVTIACLVAVLPLTVVVGGYDRDVLWPILVAYLLLVVLAGVLYLSCLRSIDRWRLVVAFRTVVVASVLFAAGWLAAVT